MANDKIIIKGAREHNLKNINLTLPREKLIVMTGLSGSGKSSLAFTGYFHRPKDHKPQPPLHRGHCD